MDLRSLIVVVMIVIGPLSAGHSHSMAGIPEEISHLRVIHTDAFIRDAESIALDISGTVMDNEGNPLIGVNIRVKGTDFGTATDADGAFYLEDVDEEAILVFSYIGYQTKEVSVA